LAYRALFDKSVEPRHLDNARGYRRGSGRISQLIGFIAPTDEEFTVGHCHVASGLAVSDRPESARAE
jgi:hypothetical protein